MNYLTLPGWKKNISGIRCFNDLPENAKKFVFTITELLEVPGIYYYYHLNLVKDILILKIISEIFIYEVVVFIDVLFITE